MDKYDKEPLSLLVLHFSWGAVGAIMLGIGGSALLSIPLFFMTGDSSYKNLIQTSIIAPISEEIAKGIFLAFTVNSRKFDNITDGLVYGGAIGLGFGMTENMLYFVTYGTTITSWIYIVTIRSLFSGVMHCLSTGTLGAFLAMAKFSDNRFRNFFPYIGFSSAILIHFSWNTLVMFENTFQFGILFMIFSILLFIFVFRLSLRNEKRIIERELAEECKEGLIPEEHLVILFSNHRFRTGWIDEEIRKLYYRNAVRLAFSKNEIKKAKGISFLYYELEIEKSREIIRKLLSKNTWQKL
jgi:protease PrsW